MITVIPNKYLVVKGRLPYNSKTAPPSFVGKLQCGKPILTYINEDVQVKQTNNSTEDAWTCARTNVNEKGEYEIYFRLPLWATDSEIVIEDPLDVFHKQQQKPITKQDVAEIFKQEFTKFMEEKNKVDKISPIFGRLDDK